MSEYKRRFELFSFYDHTGIEAHLEKMARRGWLLDKISGSVWRYRRVEPGAVAFTVVYYPEASTFDPGPGEGELTFREYCEAAGWALAASSAQMQVFYSRAEAPTPIETDASVQVGNIHAGAIKSFIPGYLALMALAVLQIAAVCSRIERDPISALSNNINLLIILAWALVFLEGVVELSGYYLWRSRAERAAEASGDFVATRGHGGFLRASLVIILLGAIAWLATLSERSDRLIALIAFGYVGLLIFLVNSVKALLKRLRASAGTNLTVTLVACVALSIALTVAMSCFTVRASREGLLSRKPAETYEHRGTTLEVYHDDLPLAVEDIAEVDGAGYSTELRTRESLLVLETTGTQRHRFDRPELTGQPTISYTLAKIKLPVIYELCLLGELRKYDRYSGGYSYQEADSGPWGAERAYQLTMDGEARDTYIVCWPERILVIDFSWPPTAEQMAITAEKLSGI